MPVHFTPHEMAARKRRLLSAMAEQRLDGMLLFAQESDYWLTGYDSSASASFSASIVGADGRRALLTRSADLRQAQRTSILDDIRIWSDGAATPSPTAISGVMLDDLGAARSAGRRVRHATA